MPGTPSFYRCFLGSKKNQTLYGSFLNRVAAATNSHHQSPRLQRPPEDFQDEDTSGIFSKAFEEDDDRYQANAKEERPRSIIDILIEEEESRKREATSDTISAP